MGILDRKYSKRDDEEPPDLEDPRTARWIAIALAALVLLAVTVAVLTPKRSPPLEKGSQLVNINTASQSQLESLPGIGPSLSQLIISGRPYADVTDLAKVRGISMRQVEQLRPMLTVSEPTRKLRQMSARERTVEWVAALTAPQIIAVSFGAVISLFYVYRGIHSLRRRYRNARTRALFEEAERKRWEGHRRG